MKRLFLSAILLSASVIWAADVPCPMDYYYMMDVPGETVLHVGRCMGTENQFNYWETLSVDTLVQLHRRNLGLRGDHLKFFAVARTGDILLPKWTPQGWKPLLEERGFEEYVEKISPCSICETYDIQLLEVWIDDLNIPRSGFPWMVWGQAQDFAQIYVGSDGMGAGVLLSDKGLDFWVYEIDNELQVCRQDSVLRLSGVCVPLSELRALPNAEVLVDRWWEEPQPVEQPKALLNPLTLFRRGSSVGVEAGEKGELRFLSADGKLLKKEVVEQGVSWFSLDHFAAGRLFLQLQTPREELSGQLNWEGTVR